MSHSTGAIVKQRTQTTSRLMFLMTFLLWWGLLAFFGMFPQIDLSVARGFFTDHPCSVLDGINRVCGEFGYDNNPLLSEVRNVLFALPYIAAAIVMASIVRSRLENGAGWKSHDTDMSFAALITLFLGCGLLVNLFLKGFSGRPRPRETSLFGGSLDFVQAGSFAGKCLKNCSFVSGEASSAGWLFCLILLLPRRWRPVAGVPLALVSFLVPVLRVMTGAHYLSDVTLGWLSSIVIFTAVLSVMETISGRKYIDAQL